MEMFVTGVSPHVWGAQEFRVWVFSTRPWYQFCRSPMTIDTYAVTHFKALLVILNHVFNCTLNFKYVVRWNFQSCLISNLGNRCCLATSNTTDRGLGWAYQLLFTRDGPQERVNARVSYAWTSPSRFQIQMPHARRKNAARTGAKFII